MKKLIATFVCVMGFVAMSLAQDATNTAGTSGADALIKSKASGEYVYTLPQAVTADLISQKAAYYVKFFTVTFDEANHEATVNMLNDEVSSRAVMIRLLTGCGVQFVEVDGEALQLQAFMDKHLQ